MSSYTVISGQTKTGVELGISDIMTVLEGGAAVNTNVNGGSMHVYSDGRAADTTVISGGILWVYESGVANRTDIGVSGSLAVSGGIANDVAISSGYMSVASGGTAGNITVDAGGMLQLWDKGRASNITVNEDGLLELDGGTADNVTVNFGGLLDIWAGSATNILENGGYVNVIDDASSVIFAQNTLYSLHLTSGRSASVHSGTTAVNTMVNSGGWLEVFSSGKVTGTLTMEVGADVIFHQGGILDFDISRMTPATPALVNDLSLIQGTPDYFITVAPDQAEGIYKLAEGVIYFDEIVTIRTTAGSGSSISVGKTIELAGQYYTLNLADFLLSVTVGPLPEPPAPDLSSSPVKTFNEEILVSGADFMTGKILAEGGVENIMHISEGGIASSTAVSSGGIMHVSEGGMAASTTVDSLGSMFVSGGGMADGTAVNDGGVLCVESGGTAVSTTVGSGASLSIEDFGSALCVLENGGYVRVQEDSVVSFAQNTFSGLVLSDTIATVHSGTTAESTVVNSGGGLAVYDGGTANGATINADGGMKVFNGGMADSAAVRADGHLFVSSGGKVTGTLTMEDGADVVIYAGGVFDFDISGLDPSATVRVNDLSLIQGAPSYSITVSADQAEGAYKLAEGAAGFDKTVAICTTGNVCDSITVGGSVTLGDLICTLNLTDTLLSLSVLSSSADIIPPEKPAAAADVTTPTNGDVTVTATFSEDSALKQFSLDGENWQEYAGGIVFTGNGIAYFRGIDEAGNFSEVTSFEVTNIDRIPPEKPAAAADVTTPTNGNVTVTATFSEDSALNQFSLDGENWQEYEGGIVFTENGIAYFRGIDEAGNFSEVTSFEVTNIDKVPPVKPAAAADVTTPTNGNVTVTAIFSEDSALKQFSLDGENWQEYADGIVFTENGTVYFRGIDEAGNFSEVTSFEVSNIYHVEPDGTKVDLLENGVSQVLAWDGAQGKVGFMATNGNPAPAWQGVWEWSGAEASLWKVVGAGHFAGSTVDHDGILLYNGIGNTFAAWTNLNDPSYGYVSLCHVDGDFQTKCLGDFDANGFDDVIIFNEKGSVGIVSDAASYHDVWHVDNAASNPWQLLGAGTFDPSIGQDSLLFRNTANNHLYLWDNQGSDIASWNWRQTDIGYLADGWEFAAIGDFKGDGIDDIVLVNHNDNDAVFVWDDGDQSTAHYVGVLGAGFKIETVGDYDADGKDDLLLREYNTGWGGIGCWSGADANSWTDFNARIETNLISSFTIVA